MEDPLYGGFYGTIDRQGHPTLLDGSQGLVHTARHLFALSTFYQPGHRDPSILQAANSLYEFLDHVQDADIPLAHF